MVLRYKFLKSYYLLILAQKLVTKSLVTKIPHINMSMSVFTFSVSLQQSIIQVHQQQQQKLKEISKQDDFRNLKCVNCFITSFQRASVRRLLTKIPLVWKNNDEKIMEKLVKHFNELGKNNKLT